MAAGLAIGVYLLVGQLAGVAEMGNIFEGAIWGWVLLTFVLGQLPQFSQAMAMLGAVTARLPFGPVVGVQFANAFTGLVGGTAGNATLTIRFFQKQGLPPAVAASSGVLTSTTGFMVQVVLIVIAVLVTGSDLNLSTGSDGDGVPGWIVAIIVALIVLGLGMLLVPKFRKKVVDTVGKQLRAAWDNLHGVLGNPRKAVQLFGGNLLSQLLYAMVLGAALHAYGESLPVLQLVLINCAASFIGGMAPVPGRHGRHRDRSDRRVHRVGHPRGASRRGHVHGPDVHLVPAADLGLVHPPVAAEERVRLTAGRTGRTSHLLRDDPARRPPDDDGVGRAPTAPRG